METQNPNVFDALPAGAMTWGGKTQGPAINVGRLRPHILGPRQLWVHFDELRDWVVKAGWHTEHDYQQLVQKHDALLTEFESLQADYAEMLEKSEGLEKALGWKKTTARKAKATA